MRVRYWLKGLEQFLGEIILATKTLRGEPLADVLPAAIASVIFQGVEVIRLIGSREQIKESTAALEEAYRQDEMQVFGDAMHVGFSRTPEKAEPVYELLVLRKVPA